MTSGYAKKYKMASHIGIALFNSSERIGKGGYYIPRVHILWWLIGPNKEAHKNTFFVNIPRVVASVKEGFYN